VVRKLGLERVSLGWLDVIDLEIGLNRVGSKGSRTHLIRAKAEELRAYLLSYQYSMRALIKALPDYVFRERPPFASVGRYEIWPCADTAVVLVYPSEFDAIEVVIRESSGKSHGEFLGTSEVATYYDEGGLPVSWRGVAHIDDPSGHIIHLANPVSFGFLGTVRPRFQKLSLFGWEAPLPQPDDEALVDLRADVAAQNLAKNQQLSISEVRDRAALLLSEFEKILEAKTREEEVQVFLADHPELLYPDFITCHPKLHLGENYVTDYVVLVQGMSGQEYVFVEIEQSDKSVFVSKGHFSQDFTQAKGQLLRWSAWISENHQYLERRLPKLGRPTFHLVMGRSAGFQPEERAILQAEFSGTDRRFSTYDDLIDRFKAIMETLLGAEVAL
jgi:hypothetical protein